MKMQRSASIILPLLKGSDNFGWVLEYVTP